MITTQTPLRIGLLGRGTDLPDYYREQSWSGITATCLMLICTCSPGRRTRQPTKARHGVIVHSLDRRERAGLRLGRAASQNRIRTESMLGGLRAC